MAVVLRSPIRTFWNYYTVIRQWYLRLCEHLYIPGDLYAVEFSQTSDGLSMSFRKDVVKVQPERAMFGKNIIITDNTDWTTSEFVEAGLDRWRVENPESFRGSARMMTFSQCVPSGGRTASKIRCYLFVCVVAMTYLRKTELKLNAAGIGRAAEDVMDDMRQFHSVLMFTEGGRKPRRYLEILPKIDMISLFVQQLPHIFFWSLIRTEETVNPGLSA